MRDFTNHARRAGFSISEYDFLRKWFFDQLYYCDHLEPEYKEYLERFETEFGWMRTIPAGAEICSNDVEKLKQFLAECFIDFETKIQLNKMLLLQRWKQIREREGMNFEEAVDWMEDLLKKEI